MADRKLRNAERRRALRYLLTGVGPEPKERQGGRVAHQTLSKLEYSLIEKGRMELVEIPVRRGGGAAVRPPIDPPTTATRGAAPANGSIPLPATGPVCPPGQAGARPAIR